MVEWVVDVGERQRDYDMEGAVRAAQGAFHSARRGNENNRAMEETTPSGVSS